MIQIGQSKIKNEDRRKVGGGQAKENLWKKFREDKKYTDMRKKNSRLGKV